jgi:hypothetical protein
VNDLRLQHLLQNQQPNMLLSLLLQQSQQNIIPSSFQNILQPVANGIQRPVQSSASAPPVSAPSSPIKALPRTVTLTEFCNVYSVPTNTEEKLQRPDVIPGDVKGITSLEREDWSGEGGFSKLGWDRFKELHACFMRDVCDGVFI